MVPVYSKNYLVSFIRPNPDLYGKHYPLKINFTYSIQLIIVLWSLLSNSSLHFTSTLYTGNLLDAYVVYGFLEPVKSFSASSVACISIVLGLGSIVYAFVCLLFV